jgi:hypothetical protein
MFWQKVKQEEEFCTKYNKLDYANSPIPRFIFGWA